MTTRPKRRRAKGLPSREAFEGERFEGLLRTLAEIVRDGRKGKEALDDAGLAYLRAGVMAAMTNYGALQFAKDDAAAQTLHKVSEPMREVIAALRSEANEAAIVVKLGRDATGLDLELGVERRAALIADLEKLAATRPPERRKGQPGNADLYQLVHTLANDWHILTGARFTQRWREPGHHPASLGARFVYAVVAFVDANNLASLPKIAEKVVAERRRGRVMPWLHFR